MFTTLLQNELVKRCRENPQYSLRAFARQLSIDPSNLSKILKGTKEIGRKSQIRILLELGISPDSVKKYCSSNGSLEDNYRDFPVERFQLISEWYHDAILELTYLPTFKGDHQWIANTLGIKKLQVDIAVKRLLEMGLLTIDKNNIWSDQMGAITTITDPNYTDQALQQLQNNILDKSKEAIKNTPANLRDHTSLMLPVDEEDIPEVKNMIKKFRRKLSRFLERRDCNPSQIYQIQVGFFPLTTINKKKTKKNTQGEKRC